MSKDNEEHRKHERVKLPYVLKFRCVEPGHEDPDWDAVNPVDMSESGVRFFTVNQYIPGFRMELLATNAILKEERIYECRILRSDKSKERPRFYQTVVVIENMAEDAKISYFKILEAFHERMGRRRGR